MLTEVCKYLGKKKKIEDKLCLYSHCSENILTQSGSCLSWNQGEECSVAVKIKSITTVYSRC